MSRSKRGLGAFSDLRVLPINLQRCRMETVILVIHMLIAVALVGLILIQKSEGGGLGIGGGTMGGMMTARGSANLLTRSTAILAGLFFATSIVLAVMAGGHGRPTSLIDNMPTSGQTSPAPAQPQQPAAPSEPAPPVAN